METWRDEQWRTAGKKDAPNYTDKSPAPSQNCRNCRYINKGKCELFQFKPKPGAWCSSWGDGKFYGWWGGGRFPRHGVPPDEPTRPEDLDAEGGTTGDSVKPNETLPSGNNNPSQGSGIPGNISR